MENHVLKKLNIKPGSTLFLDQAPENAAAALGEIPASIKVVYREDENFDRLLIFAKMAEELRRRLVSLGKYLKPDTIIWIAYPKKNSGIPTDLNMMGFWDEVKAVNFSPCSSAAINDVWTAIRLKPSDQVKSSGQGNESIRNNALGEFIDVDKKQITLPPDLALALKDYPEAHTFFDSLSWSNRKEYVVWVLTAKQQATRDSRISKMISKLAERKKNPTEK